MRNGATLYVTTPHGQRACRLCAGSAVAHAPECPVVALRLQVREIVAELGLFISTLTEAVDQLDKLLRDDVQP